jgi:quercetin dioxygenase-like cupin family protein
VEFILVVQGSLGLRVGTDEHVLGAGDSVYFESTVPHAYRRVAGRTCSAVVVTAP